MYRKSLLPSLLLSLVGFLILSDAADAQLFGRRNARQAARGWNQYVAPISGGYMSWYASPYNDGRVYGSYYDVAPTYSQSYYHAPADYTPATVNNSVAHVRVLVPDANAAVWFNGTLMQQRGTDRLFHTPPLQGASNQYKVRATWMQGGREMTQERMVTVHPGASVTVDFSQASSEQLPAAQPQPAQPVQTAQPRQPDPLPPAQVQQLEGRILRTVGTDQFIILTRDNREVTVFTNPETRFLMDGRAVGFTDLQVNRNVTFGYTMQGGRHIANTITINAALPNPR